MVKEIQDQDVIKIVEGSDVYEGTFEKPDFSGKDAAKFAVYVAKIKQDQLSRRSFADHFSVNEENENIQVIDGKIEEAVLALKAVFSSRNGSDRDVLSKREIYDFLVKIMPTIEALQG